MRIAVDVNHPANVHYFRHFIEGMKKKGHEIKVVASEKDVTCDLLRGYGIDYVKIGSYGKSLPEKLLNLFIMDMRMYRAVRDFNPDVFLGFGSIRSAHVSYLMRKKCVNFDDTEHSVEQKLLWLSLVDKVCTPSCYKRDLGKKQSRFDGYMELAYLHPSYFKPDPSSLAMAGLKEGEPFTVMRLVSWDATHDVGHRGITDRESFVKDLQRYGKVVITSEAPLEGALKDLQVKAPPHRMHDLLYYASLYVGEGATMATEAALLGTPSIYVSTLSGTMGNHDELENRYRLLYSCRDPALAREKALDILGSKDARTLWRERRDAMLRDKTDVTAFIISAVESVSG